MGGAGVVVLVIVSFVQSGHTEKGEGARKGPGSVRVGEEELVLVEEV